MPQGHQTTPEIQWAIVRLSKYLDHERIATCLNLSTRSVQRVLAHFQTYGTIPNPCDGTVEKMSVGKCHLRDVDVEFLLGTVPNSPDPYLDEFQEMLEASCGIHVSRDNLWRTLSRAGFTMKKITRVSVERAAVKRTEYLARIGVYRAEQLVFVDESSLDRRVSYCGRAWSIRGAKAQRKAFFVRGRRYSVLPALSLQEGILHCDVVEGSFCDESFAQFIRKLLDNMRPFPAPNSVIVMDNCPIHKHPNIRELIESRGMRCEFLPPYSPDLNPIELAVSAMKYNLRCNGDYARLATTRLTGQDVYIALLKALCMIPLEDIFGWFSHCGYV